MSKAWCVVRGLAALILVALLVIGGIAIHRIGWSQGYIVGQLAARGDQGMAVPYGFGPMGILLALDPPAGGLTAARSYRGGRRPALQCRGSGFHQRRAGRAVTRTLRRAAAVPRGSLMPDGIAQQMFNERESLVDIEYFQ